jgi:hypothetical protein
VTFKFCDLVFMTGLLPRHGNVQRGRAPEYVRPLMGCSQEGQLGAITLMLCDAEDEGTRNRSVAACPLWVKSRNVRRNKSCPLYPRERTFAAHWRMSAKCQKRT